MFAGVALLTLAVAVMARPAFAQADLTGIWQPLYQEDQPERIPGPELVDYLGLPINDAARQFRQYRGGIPGGAAHIEHPIPLRDLRRLDELREYHRLEQASGANDRHVPVEIGDRLPALRHKALAGHFVKGGEQVELSHVIGADLALDHHPPRVREVAHVTICPRRDYRCLVGQAGRKGKLA